MPLTDGKNQNVKNSIKLKKEYKMEQSFKLR